MSPDKVANKSTEGNVAEQAPESIQESFLQIILSFFIRNTQFLRPYFGNPEVNRPAQSNGNTMAPAQQKPVIFVIGGPGSGKGTICDRIKAKYGFTHFSTGDLLREEVASGSEKGKQLNEVMVSGKLVSNDQVLDLLQSAIQKRQATANGFLIDGYPRQVDQAIDFEKKVCPCSVILYFNCSDAEMTKRLLNRGLTSGRADDNEETIKKRLDTFHSHTQPILDHFKAKLENIDSERPVDQVFVDVEKVLQKLVVK